MTGTVLDTIQEIVRRMGPAPPSSFPEEAGYKYRYYTDEAVQDMKMSPDQFRRYIKTTMWDLAGHDDAYGMWVCRRLAIGD